MDSWRYSRAPVWYTRCPEHKQIVATDGDGRLLGHCATCAGEAAAAIARLRWPLELREALRA